MLKCKNIDALQTFRVGPSPRCQGSGKRWSLTSRAGCSSGISLSSLGDILRSLAGIWERRCSPEH